jgi:ribose 5-phosphate isomerase B
MHIYVASDHAGFTLKNFLTEFLKGEGHEVEDCGPAQENPEDDYPDYCIRCAQKVAADARSFGIVIGLSGQGEAMAANRVKGARAAVFYGGPNELLLLSRQHNNANILSLGAKFISETQAKEAVTLWLATDFSNDARHLRRIDKLDNL